ncbi:glycoside hydrolase [Xylariales sp. PMI_506]|nr:glycoside hydrolase [Xylariales sp. PMI_506]
MFVKSAAAALVALLLSATPAASRNVTSRDTAGTKRVFAHYMVGYTDGQALSQWVQDMQYAQLSGIDGFALNMGTDSWQPDQIALAYEAANELDDFWVFISFDMSSYTWDVTTVVDLIEDFAGNAAQYTVNGVPFVSTFEGTAFAEAGDWTQVRDQVSIYLVPDWSSIGSYGVQSDGLLADVDGLFSWDAWPAAGATEMTDSDDLSYVDVLGGKPYMMPVSPYFYCPLTEYSKNWYASSDRLWWDRWKQVMAVMPEYVEIITWNDYSESSYISTPASNQVDLGDVETRYVDGYDHAPFRFLLGYFISAYKAGTPDVSLTYEGGLAWYRTTPKSLSGCSDDGTLWGLDDEGTLPAEDGMSDVVNIAVLSSSSPSISLTIGGSAVAVTLIDTYAPYAYFYQASFTGYTGDVVLTINGASATGPEQITDSCPSSGLLNFNAVAFNVNS